MSTSGIKIVYLDTLEMISKRMQVKTIGVFGKISNPITGS